jgi:hypothetical protein
MLIGSDCHPAIDRWLERSLYLQADHAGKAAETPAAFEQPEKLARW